MIKIISYNNGKMNHLVSEKEQIDLVTSFLAFNDNIVSYNIPLLNNLDNRAYVNPKIEFWINEDHLNRLKRDFKNNYENVLFESVRSQFKLEF